MGGGITKTINDAIVDAWYFLGDVVGVIFPPKKKVYRDVKVEKVYPSNLNAFRQKLVFYKNQTQSNLMTMRKLIMDKATKTNIKTYSKFGFLKLYEGKASVISLPLVQLYIANKTKDTNINIKYQTKRQYYIYLLKTYHNRYYDDYITEKVKYKLVDDYRDINTYPQPIQWTETDNCLGPCEYKWLYTGAYKDPTINDATLQTIDNLDYKIQQYLNENYSITHEKQVSTFYTYFINTTVEIIFNTYEIDDTKYVPVIENGKVKCTYDEDNNVNIVTLENINDSSDTIDIDIPTDNSNLIVVYYTSEKYPKGNTLIFYQEEILHKYEHLNFFIVPLKQDGKKIKYKDEYTTKWLKDNGLVIPKALDDESVLDQALAYSTSYNPSRYKTLKAWNTFVYGNDKNRSNVTIEKNGINFNYYWSVDYTASHTITSRHMTVNGYDYMTAIDKVDEPNALYYYNKDTDENTFSSTSLGSKAIDTTNNNLPTELNPHASVYLVPIEALRSMPISEFHDAYLDLLYNFIYVYNEIEIQWYQTELFQYIVQGAVIAVSCTLGGPVACATAIGGTILYTVLVDSGMDPTTAAIITVVVSWGASTYVSGSTTLATQSANTTTSLTGSGLQSAATNAMSNTTSTVSFTSVVNDVTYASVNYSFTEIMAAGIETSLASGITAIDYINAANTGVNFYTQYDIKKQQRRLKYQQDDYNQILNDVTILQKQLEDFYNSTVTLSPRDRFDHTYAIMYDNPMALQEGLDRSIFYTQFNPIETVYK